MSLMVERGVEAIIGHLDFFYCSLLLLYSLMKVVLPSHLSHRKYGLGDFLSWYSINN